VSFLISERHVNSLSRLGFEQHFLSPTQCCDCNFTTVVSAQCLFYPFFFDTLLKHYIEIEHLAMI